MQKFKVIPLAVSGLAGQVFASGDIIAETQVEKDNIPRLVLKGFLHPLDENGNECERVIITQEHIDENPEAARILGAVPGDFSYIPAPQLEDHEPPAGEVVKREVTEEDLVNNPELAENGVKVGDVIEFPATPAVESEGSGTGANETPATGSAKKATTKKANDKK